MHNRTARYYFYAVYLMFFQSYFIVFNLSQCSKVSFIYNRSVTDRAVKFSHASYRKVERDLPL